MKETFLNRFKELMESKNMTQSELSKKTGITQSSISDWLRGKYLPKQDKIDLLARALEVSSSYLMGWRDESGDPILENIPGVIMLNKGRRIPILGTIACGEPLLAVENLDGYFLCDPTIVRGDFALKCKGDSMINENINEGDLVFIKSASDVDDGKVAVVIIDDEATLKKVYKNGDSLILQPCNPSYKPIIISGEDCKDIRIIGEMVGVYSIR